MSSNQIDFITIKANFNKLSNGQKAELRRVTKLEDIFKIGISYRLIPKGEKPNKQWERVLLFLPFGEHVIDGYRLGELLARVKIKEQKLEQALKSSSPNDLMLLRDLIRWCDQKDLCKLDYQYLGQCLYYWGAGYKQSIGKDYFLTCRKMAEELSQNPKVESITDLMNTLQDTTKVFDGLELSSAIMPTIDSINQSINQRDAIESPNNSANLSNNLPNITEPVSASRASKIDSLRALPTKAPVEKALSKRKTATKASQVNPANQVDKTANLVKAKQVKKQKSKE